MTSDKHTAEPTTEHSSMEELTLEQKINRETARICWNELAPHFAAGNLITVSPELDLIVVAKAMAENNAEQIKTWMSQQQVHNTHDSEAIGWQSNNSELWAAVVKPWVLVQDSGSNQTN